MPVYIPHFFCISLRQDHVLSLVPSYGASHHHAICKNGYIGFGGESNGCDANEGGIGLCNFNLYDERSGSISRMVRKFTKSKAIFPTDDSIQKVVYLSVREIMKKWTMTVRGWGMAYSQIIIFFGGRFAA